MQEMHKDDPNLTKSISLNDQLLQQQEALNIAVELLLQNKQ